ncbi:calcium-binding protein [Brucella sp. HL-2]|nr:calcium-binding protein [Brucella sp. HL-2]MCV9907033.1 calcium-binding protein [Brucella sp. HL-2]
MTDLSQEQFDKLSEIANSGQSGARALYYTTLASYGIDYGNLALGVVFEDQLSGKVANEYFMRVAASEGVNVSNQQWDAIGNDLMHRDLDARFAKRDQHSDGGRDYYTYSDLTYQDIENYHDRAFGTLGGTVPEGQGVSIAAWTAWLPVQVLGETVAWDWLVSGDYLDFKAGSAVILATIELTQWSGGSLGPLADMWTEAVWEAIADVSRSPAFPINADTAVVNMGTRGDDYLDTHDLMVAGKQTIVLGLGGNDTILGNGTDARIDGGSGSDRLVLQTPSDVRSTDTTINGIDQGFSGNVTYFNNSHDLIEGEKFHHIEALTGTSLDDKFTLSSHSSREFPTLAIDGGEGADRIHFSLDTGNIVIDLNKTVGTATISDIDGPGSVTLNLQNIEDIYADDGNDLIFGNAANNTLSLSSGKNEAHGRGGDDNLLGGDQTDNLYGDDGNDHLSGGDSNDFLDGGAGDDVLTGGSGSDQFQISAGTDVFFDFSLGEDRLIGTNLTFSEAPSAVMVTADQGYAMLYGLALDDVLNCQNQGLLLG